ncbi:cell division protein [Algoriphagus sp. SE2]|uniref:cell division protein FtsQ/DivIB n=1 Tax=Algoriphagus sp. SE2 TaxID=3141536 RepID=UPI0031CD6503
MKKIRIKKTLVFLVLCIVLIGFIGFVEKQTLYKTYQGAEIDINGVSGVYFVEEKEVQEILKAAFPELKAGLMLEEVRLKEVEQRLNGHPFIKSVEASLGQKGILHIKIEQHQPIARIARSYAADGYITVEGKVIPTSPSYTSRVLILQGKEAELIMEKGDVNEQMPELMDLINFIVNDDFWSAQIPELEINSKTDIQMMQQVGKQVIDFGGAQDIAEKFKKIEVFYKEILPRKGWNAYERVSVKFKDQIVCE